MTSTSGQSAFMFVFVLTISWALFAVTYQITPDAWALPASVVAMALSGTVGLLIISRLDR